MQKLCQLHGILDPVSSIASEVTVEQHVGAAVVRARQCYVKYRPVVDPRCVTHPLTAVGAGDVDAREAAVEISRMVVVL